MQDYDSLRSGEMTKSQFRRCLSDIGISAIGHFNINEGQFHQLCQRYQSRNAREKVVWTSFMDDINSSKYSEWFTKSNKLTLKVVRNYKSKFFEEI